MSDTPTTFTLIPITDLFLDTENYRLGQTNSQIETIQAMIAEQGEKIANLAEDIVTNGLSPIDLIAVIPTESKNKYKVIEGNRRVTALKLLNEPALANDTEIFKEIKALSAKARGQSIKECRCWVFKTKQEAFLWMERKHHIGLEGMGTEPWSALAIRRAQEAQGQSQAALEVVDYVLKNASLSETEKKQISSIPITNLERILDDKESLKQLGLDIKESQLVSSQSPDWTLEILTRIVKDIASKKIKVQKIFTKEDRAKYISAIQQEQKAKPSSAKPWSIKTGAAVNKDSSSGSSKGGKVKPVSTDRKTLIPNTCKIQINHPRINDMFRELRKLKIDDFPNAGAILFRVFIELSAEEFAKKYSVQVTPMDKLSKKVTAVIDYMTNNGIMDHKKTKPIRNAINNPNDVLSIETWNAYVHSSIMAPKPTDLKISWNTLEPFVEALWK